MSLTANFVADFSNFFAALQQSEAKLRGFKTTVDDVGPALDRMVDKFSGRKIVEQATLATKAVQEIGGVANLTGDEIAYLNRTLTEAIEKLGKMKTPVPENMRALAEETKKASAETKAGATSWEGYGKALSTVNGILGTVGIGVSVGAIVSLGKAVISDASELVKLSAKTGITVEGLQRLQAAAEASGNTLDELSTAVTAMQVRLAGGDQSALGALEKLGISLAQLKTLSPDQQFTKIASAIGKIEDPMQRADLAMALFGKTGTAVLPTMRSDIDALASSTKIWSEETTKRLEAAGNEWSRLYHNLKIWSGDRIAGIRAEFEEYDRQAKFLKAGLNSGNAADIISGLQAPKAPPISAALPQIKLTNEQLAEQDRLLKKDIASTNELVSKTTKLAAEQKALKDAVYKVNYDIAYSELHMQGLGDQSAYAFTQFNKWRDPNLAAGIGQIGVALGEVDKNFARVAARQKEAYAASGGKVGNQIDLSGLGAQPDVGIPALVKPGILQGFGNLFSKDVPQTILGALMGGGNPVAAVGTLLGTQLGTNVANSLKGPLTSGLGKMLGGAVGSALPIVGSLIGPAIGAIGKLFGKSEETKVVSPLRNKLMDAAGGFDALNLAAYKAGTTITGILQAKTADQYKAALDSLNSAFQQQQASLDLVVSTAERYGFTLEELGPAMQRQELDKQAQQLYQDFNVLNSAGLATVDITTKMADSVNAYVQQALAMGTEVPAAMKPMLEALIAQGQLTDANGNKIDSLEESGISFALTMSDGFKQLIASVDQLATVISRSLGTAISDTTYKINQMPRHVGVEVEYSTRGSAVPVSTPAPDLEQYQNGTDGFRDFGAGTPVMLHGLEAVVPFDRSGGGAPSGEGGAPTVIVNAQGAFFDTPGSVQQLADKVGAALSAKYGLTHRMRAA